LFLGLQVDRSVQVVREQFDSLVPEWLPDFCAQHSYHQ